MSQLSAKSRMSLDFEDMDKFVREQQAIEAKNKENLPLTKRELKALMALDPETVHVENAALAEIGQQNWIGMLVEYRQVNPVASEDIWNFSNHPSTNGLRFTFTLKIAECDEVFGSGSYGFSGQVASFSTKKIARQYAAMLAIKWLIQNKYKPDNGAARFPRVVAPQALPAHFQDRSEVSYATQVPQICTRLGFNPPRYAITQVVDGTPLYDAYADFGADPRIDGKVGEVTNVFGKKNAKEQVAKGVFHFMENIERNRSMPNQLGENAVFNTEPTVAMVTTVTTMTTAVEYNEAEDENLTKEDSNADESDDKKRKRSISEASKASKKSPKVGVENPPIAPASSISLPG